LQKKTRTEYARNDLYTLLKYIRIAPQSRWLQRAIYIISKLQYLQRFMYNAGTYDQLRLESSHSTFILVTLMSVSGDR